MNYLLEQELLKALKTGNKLLDALVKLAEKKGEGNEKKDS